MSFSKYDYDEDDYEMEDVEAVDDPWENIPEFHKEFNPPTDVPLRGLAPSEFRPCTTASDEPVHADLMPNGYVPVVNQFRQGQHVYMLSLSIHNITLMLQRFHVPFDMLESPFTVYQYGRSIKYGDLFGLYTGHIGFVWKGTYIRVLQLPDYSESIDEHVTAFAYADDVDELARFSTDLRAFTLSPPSRDAVFVYRGGWINDSSMREDISTYSWDDLILPAEMKSDIQNSAHRFFTDGAKISAALRVPFRRGFLFEGDPGGGKTLTAKIIANTEHVRLIYVMSLYGQHITPNDSIAEIFKKAAESAPCVVLFEDLDSQIDESTRAVFLNTLDGFSAGRGILTIATTNHPEHIDPALRDRPSRFDTKWAFPYLNEGLRFEYLCGRVKRLLGQDADTVLEPRLLKVLSVIAKDTDKHSTAMLQELVVRASYAYMDNPTTEGVLKALRDASEYTKLQTKLGKIEGIHKAIKPEMKSQTRII